MWYTFQARITLAKVSKQTVGGLLNYGSQIPNRVLFSVIYLAFFVKKGRHNYMHVYVINKHGHPVMHVTLERPECFYRKERQL